MKTFNTLHAAESFINGLNIPESEIENIQSLPQIFRPLEVRLKWADCDLIVISNTWVGNNPNRPDDPPYKNVFQVEKRYYSAPALLSEVCGMTPNRYKTPEF